MSGVFWKWDAGALRTERAGMRWRRECGGSDVTSGNVCVVSRQGNCHGAKVG